MANARGWSAPSARSVAETIAGAARERRTIVCACHDVTERDVRAAWDAGYRHPDTLKRFTAAFMGPCQGKHCAPLVQQLIDELGGSARTSQRRPSVRPPLYPVRLGELAGPRDDEQA